MPIVDHNAVPETPWRPNYRKWDLAGPEEGVSSTLAYSIVGVGAGAPLHVHQDDEIIVILEGTLEVRLGEEVHEVGGDHTLVIPRDVPHGFSCVGPGEARILAFFPVADAFERTQYLQGGPPDRT